MSGRSVRAKISRYDDEYADEAAESVEDEAISDSELDESRPKKKQTRFYTKPPARFYNGGVPVEEGLESDTNKQGRTNPSKKVKVVTSKGVVLSVYESGSEAGRVTGINAGNISHVANGKQAHANGFIFQFADADTETYPLTLQQLTDAKQRAIDRGEEVVSEKKTYRKRRKSGGVEDSGGIGETVYGEDGSVLVQASSGRKADAEGVDNPLPKLKKQVQVVTSRGVILAVYESGRSAERLTRVKHSKISLVCNGKRNRAKGFAWQFAEAGTPNNELSLEDLTEAKRRAIENGEEDDDSVKRPRKSRMLLNVKREMDEDDVEGGGGGGGGGEQDIGYAYMAMPPIPAQFAHMPIHDGGMIHVQANMIQNIITLPAPAPSIPL